MFVYVLVHEASDFVKIYIFALFIIVYKETKYNICVLICDLSQHQIPFISEPTNFTQNAC